MTTASGGLEPHVDQIFSARYFPFLFGIFYWNKKLSFLLKKMFLAFQKISELFFEFCWIYWLFSPRFQIGTKIWFCIFFKIELIFQPFQNYFYFHQNFRYFPHHYNIWRWKLTKLRQRKNFVKLGAKIHCLYFLLDCFWRTIILFNYASSLN